MPKSTPRPVVKVTAGKWPADYHGTTKVEIESAIGRCRLVVIEHFGSLMLRMHDVSGRVHFCAPTHSSPFGECIWSSGTAPSREQIAEVARSQAGTARLAPPAACASGGMHVAVPRDVLGALCAAAATHAVDDWVVLAARAILAAE